MGSKQIKCLQLPENFKYLFDKYQYLVYKDHKFSIRPDCIPTNIRYFGDYCLIVSNPRNRETVWDEFNIAIKQGRYKCRQQQMAKYINMKSQLYSVKGNILRTGLIFYNLDATHRDLTLRIAKEFYDDIMLMDCPECQICFFFIYQKFQREIKLIYHYGAATPPSNSNITTQNVTQNVTTNNLIKINSKIKTATYGTSNHSINITDKLLAVLILGNPYNLKVSNQFAGIDPILGTIKELVIYLENGQEIKIKEGTTKTITLLLSN